jgi:hypothetical protein
VGVVDREGHQARRLVAGVAEHQALVAGALVEVEAFAFIHALGDVGGLAVDRGEHRAALVVEADVGIVVADALDGLAGDVHVVDVGLGGDLAGDHHQAGGHQGLAGHPAAGSWARMASSTASEIWSATLSGWPSETDSEVNRYSLAMQRSSKAKIPSGSALPSLGISERRRFSSIFGRPGSLAALCPRPASCRINSAESQL